MIITMIKKQISPALLGLILLTSLAGCSLLPQDAKEDVTTLSVPPLEVDSQKTCGNESRYTLNGRTYNVLDSATGYVEEGRASWYGAEFQGIETAGCESFDMNAFSAAHRTLPLPSFARVTHVASGRSVIVRVNDRGPFEGKGLIQLSFAAANALGMTGNRNTARVRVEGIDPDSQVKLPNLPTTSTTLTNQPKSQSEQVPAAQQREIARVKDTGTSFYVVVDNFELQEEALDMFVRLTGIGLSKTEMASAVRQGKTLHQVRIGPLYAQDQIDNVKDTLESNGLATFKVVEVEQ